MAQLKNSMPNAPGAPFIICNADDKGRFCHVLAKNFFNSKGFRASADAFITGIIGRQTIS
jgi:hypothetical protein